MPPPLPPCRHPSLHAATHPSAHPSPHPSPHPLAHPLAHPSRRPPRSPLSTWGRLGAAMTWSAAFSDPFLIVLRRYDLVNSQLAGRPPLEATCRHYMLVELSGSHASHDEEKLATFLEAVMTGTLLLLTSYFLLLTSYFLEAVMTGTLGGPTRGEAFFSRAATGPHTMHDTMHIRSALAPHTGRTPPSEQ